jgi:hypothetical protein
MKFAIFFKVFHLEEIKMNIYFRFQACESVYYSFRIFYRLYVFVVNVIYIYIYALKVRSTQSIEASIYLLRR